MRRDSLEGSWISITQIMSWQMKIPDKDIEDTESHNELLTVERESEN